MKLKFAPSASIAANRLLAAVASNLKEQKLFVTNGNCKVLETSSPGLIQMPTCNEPNKLTKQIVLKMIYKRCGDCL